MGQSLIRIHVEDPKQLITLPPKEHPCLSGRKRTGKTEATKVEKCFKIHPVLITARVHRGVQKFRQKLAF